MTHREPINVPYFNSRLGCSILSLFSRADTWPGPIEGPQNLRFRFWPIRIQDFDSDHSESRILVSANQNLGFRFGQSESRILILVNQNPGF